MIKCNLKALRFNNGMVTQDELSKATGIRKQTISDMEVGKTKSYSVENLNAICKFFKCQINDIIEYEPDTEERL